FGQAVGGTIHRKDRPAGIFGARVGFVLVDAHALDALLNFAHAGEILIELGFVGVAYFAAQRVGARFHAIENALVAQAAAIFKEAVERQRRIDFVGDRRFRALPGDVR